MPPVKVKIEKIESQRVRQHTFQKRKTGLIKKAIELTILCDCDCSIIINKRHTSSNARSARLVAYSNRNIQDMIAECWDDLEKCTQVTNAVYPKATIKSDSAKEAAANDNDDDEDDGEGEGEGEDAGDMVGGEKCDATHSGKAPKASGIHPARAAFDEKIALTIRKGKVFKVEPVAATGNALARTQSKGEDKRRQQQAMPALDAMDVSHLAHAHTLVQQQNQMMAPHFAPIQQINSQKQQQQSGVGSSMAQVQERQPQHYFQSARCGIQQAPLQQGSGTQNLILSGRDAPQILWNQGASQQQHSAGAQQQQYGSYCGGSNNNSGFSSSRPENLQLRDSFDKSLSFAMNNADTSMMHAAGSMDSICMPSKPSMGFDASHNICAVDPFAGDWETVHESRARLAIMGRQPSASQGFGAFNGGNPFGHAVAVGTHGSHAAMSVNVPQWS